MYFNRQDVIEAHYAFCNNYHNGISCPLYERMCKISKYYKPSVLWRGYESLSENGKDIYDNLIEKLVLEKGVPQHLTNT